LPTTRQKSRGKCGDQRAPGQAELLQSAGEAEAVDKAEAEGVTPPLLDIAREEVLGRHVNDGRGNRRLGDGAWKPANNPWYLLATLYGQPTPNDRELQARNRRAWNRYISRWLTADDRFLLNVPSHAEETAPFSAEELADLKGFHRTSSKRRQYSQHCNSGVETGRSNRPLECRFQ
jgi:hypothetical protein